MPRREKNVAIFLSITVTFFSQRWGCPAVRPRLRLKMWRRPGFDSRHQVKNKIRTFGYPSGMFSQILYSKRDNNGMQHTACFMQMANRHAFRSDNIEHPAYLLSNWQKHIVNVAMPMVTYILRRLLEILLSACNFALILRFF
jgi:hypothetical protein